VAAIDRSSDLWVTDTEGTVLWHPPHQPRRRALALWEGHVAVGSRTGDVEVFDHRTGDRLWVLSGPNGAIGDLDVSPSGHFLGAAGFDGTVWVWDLRTGALHAALQGHDHRVSTLTFASEDLLVSGSWDATIRRWDLATARLPPAELVHTLHQDHGLRMEGARVVLSP
jgi:WD40 repeat protein